jgi:hypothetical protein
VSATVIARVPPNDGREWDSQCARCGSSLTHESCYACGGEGFVDCYDEDPLWYDEDDFRTCDVCGGTGGWLRCLSTFGEDEQPQGKSWCEEHPLPGREDVSPNAAEWFTLDREPSPSQPSPGAPAGTERKR